MTLIGNKILLEGSKPEQLCVERGLRQQDSLSKNVFNTIFEVILKFTIITYEFGTSLRLLRKWLIHLGWELIRKKEQNI